jgi:hypothetical protein
MNHLTRPEPRDRSKINVQNLREVKRWAHALGISQDQLRFLVEKVGSSAAMVRKEIEILREDARGANDDS